MSFAMSLVLEGVLVDRLLRSVLLDNEVELPDDGPLKKGLVVIVLDTDGVLLCAKGIIVEDSLLLVHRVMLLRDGNPDEADCLPVDTGAVTDGIILLHSKTEVELWPLDTVPPAVL